MAVNKTTADIIFEAHNAGQLGETAVVEALVAIINAQEPNTALQTILDDFETRIAALEAV